MRPPPPLRFMEFPFSTAHQPPFWWPARTVDHVAVIVRWKWAQRQPTFCRKSTYGFPKEGCRSSTPGRDNTSRSKLSVLRL